MVQPDAFDFLCIGSGPAGQKAAIQAAKAGFRTGVVERESQVGGACLLSGTIPSKALREQALRYRRMRGSASSLAVELRGDAPLSGVAYHLGEMVAPYVPFAEPLAVQDQHFIDCIANGSSPCVDGRSGLAVVQVLECAQISLREQRPVALTEVTQQPSEPPAGLDPTLARTSVG